MSNQSRVYIMKFKMHEQNTWVYKIGKSSGKNSVDRMLQIARSFFMKYRYIPLMTLKRDREAPDAFTIETRLHQEFQEFKYYHDKPIDGKEEFFLLDREDTLLRAYDNLLPAKGKQ